MCERIRLAFNSSWQETYVISAFVVQINCLWVFLVCFQKQLQ